MCCRALGSACFPVSCLGSGLHIRVHSGRSGAAAALVPPGPPVLPVPLLLPLLPESQPVCEYPTPSPATPAASPLLSTGPGAFRMDLLGRDYSSGDPVGVKPQCDQIFWLGWSSLILQPHQRELALFTALPVLPERSLASPLSAQAVSKQSPFSRTCPPMVGDILKLRASSQIFTSPVTAESHLRAGSLPPFHAMLRALVFQGRGTAGEVTMQHRQCHSQSPVAQQLALCCAQC